MELTQQEMERAKEWIDSHAPKLRCFCCGNGRWQVANKAAMTVMCDTHTGRVHYMEGYPMIALICANCAHIVWFSAPMMGLKPELGEAKAPTQNAPPT